MISPQRLCLLLIRSYVIGRRMDGRALMMRTRLLSWGCPTMGRKAAVGSARAEMRAVGVMVTGWEGLNDICDNL